MRMRPFSLFAQAFPFAIVASLIFSTICTPAAPPEVIGIGLLRTTTTNLDGSGIRIAQVEASEVDGTPPHFEVNPTDPSVNSSSLFIYYSDLGIATNYPNSVGVESWHANNVAQYIYGIFNGVATNVSRVDNFQADHFVNTFIGTSPTNPGAMIINQSFTYGPQPVPFQQSEDSAYDDTAVRFGTLYITSAGNSDGVQTPATCYNGIGVAAFGGLSSVGPTPDNGRCKPDICAPGGVTSFSTPFVSGAAAVLRQAGLRGDGGTDTNSAVDMRMIKALLLNGAVKPSDWTNGPSSPLDARFGSGIVNVFNSYIQLTGRKHDPIESASVVTNSAHPPGSNNTSISGLSGWNFTSLSSSPGMDRVSHYYFSATNGLSNALYTVNATLVWNRQTNQTAINDLDLFLYDVGTSNLIAQSISGVDNVEHIFTNVPPGRYDLQVLKYGGSAANGNITSEESYALAYAFFPVSLNLKTTTTNAVVTWPIYPAGYTLQSTLNLAQPWSTLSPNTITNGTNRVELSLTNSQLFRLQRP